MPIHPMQDVLKGLEARVLFRKGENPKVLVNQSSHTKDDIKCTKAFMNMVSPTQPGAKCQNNQDTRADEPLTSVNSEQARRHAPHSHEGGAHSINCVAHRGNVSVKGKLMSRM
jgi:hypothetical protein